MLEVNRVSKTYNKGNKNEFKALNDVSFCIKDGEMLAIVGKSGAGKSTLLHIIGAMDGYDAGTVKVDGVELNSLSENRLSRLRNKSIGIVMQDFALVEDYTVAENVELPLYFSHIKSGKRRELVSEAVNAVGISGLSGKLVRNLSGGEKQRTAIARAIVNRPSIILADEPTGALDSGTTEEIMQLFKTINEKGTSVVIVTHDKNVADMCDRIIEIKDGGIVE